MAKAYTGRDGSLRLSDVDQVKVRSWSLSADLNLLDITTLADDEKAYTPGIQSFNGSANLLYYKQDDGTNDASALLRKIVKKTGVTTSDAVALTLRLADGTSYSDVKMNAYITGVQIGVTTGDVVSTDITFQATGSLTTASL